MNVTIGKISLCVISSLSFWTRNLQIINAYRSGKGTVPTNKICNFSFASFTDWVCSLRGRLNVSVLFHLRSPMKFSFAFQPPLKGSDSFHWEIDQWNIRKLDAFNRSKSTLPVHLFPTWNFSIGFFSSV